MEGDWTAGSSDLKEATGHWQAPYSQNGVSFRGLNKQLDSTEPPLPPILERTAGETPQVAVLCGV